MNAPAYDIGSMEWILNELRLPVIGRLWSDFVQRPNKEGRKASQLLGALFAHKLVERAKPRLERNRVKSQLDPSKTPAFFDFSVVPVVSKAHLMALVPGDAWIERGATILLLGPQGGGKSRSRKRYRTPP